MGGGFSKNNKVSPVKVAIEEEVTRRLVAKKAQRKQVDPVERMINIEKQVDQFLDQVSDELRLEQDEKFRKNLEQATPSNRPLGAFAVEALNQKNKNNSNNHG